jgi:spore maturation protein B
MTLSSFGHLLSNGIFLSLIAGIPLYGFLKGVKVYDSFIEGAKDGFSLVIRILPYLIAMLVAIGMFRAAGGFSLLGESIAPLLNWLGIPTEIFPLAVLRPFSGSASIAMLSDIANTHGGDSLITRTAATILGSTETTFYVLAIYFGSVGIRYTRHAIPVGLIADAVGVIAAVWICKVFF